jgi:hypothetical protein
MNNIINYSKQGRRIVYIKRKVQFLNIFLIIFLVKILIDFVNERNSKFKIFQARPFQNINLLS